MKHDDLAGPPHLRASSDELRATTFSATLEVPLEAGKNTLYAGTFGLAWAALEERSGAPAEVQGLPLLGPALRASAAGKDDIDEAAYVARAVRGPKGLAALRAELRAKLGGAASANLLPPALADDALLVYAYLFKNLALETPLARDDEGSLRFAGKPVACFGLWETNETSLWETRANQVVVHDHVSDENFIIELLTRETDDRLLLARIPRENTLLETVRAALARAATAPSWFRRFTGSARLGRGEKLQVPILDFDLLHSYRELIGRCVLPINEIIEDARQSIRLRLDERGALLKSEMALGLRKGGGPALPPRMFLFDGPFLLLMLRRERKIPYLALWVDNLELLTAPRPGV